MTGIGLSPSAPTAADTRSKPTIPHKLEANFTTEAEQELAVAAAMVKIISQEGYTSVLAAYDLDGLGQSLARTPEVEAPNLSPESSVVFAKDMAWGLEEIQKTPFDDWSYTDGGLDNYTDDERVILAMAWKLHNTLPKPSGNTASGPQSVDGPKPIVATGSNSLAEYMPPGTQQVVGISAPPQSETSAETNPTSAEMDPATIAQIVLLVMGQMPQYVDNGKGLPSSAMVQKDFKTVLQQLVQQAKTDPTILEKANAVRGQVYNDQLEVQVAESARSKELRLQDIARHYAFLEQLSANVHERDMAGLATTRAVWSDFKEQMGKIAQIRTWYDNRTLDSIAPTELKKEMWK